MRITNLQGKDRKSIRKDGLQSFRLNRELDPVESMIICFFEISFFLREKESATFQCFINSKKSKKSGIIIPIFILRRVLS